MPKIIGKNSVREELNNEITNNVFCYFFCDLKGFL